MRPSLMAKDNPIKNEQDQGKKKLGNGNSDRIYSLFQIISLSVLN